MTAKTPWHAEYELDRDRVRDVIQRNTELRVDSVTYLGEGWDFFNWLVNEDCVFRFPKRHSDIDTLVREQRLLRRLQLPVAIPNVEHWVEKPTDFHVPFAGYAYLPGAQLLTMPADECELAAVGKTLGEILSILHQQQLTPPLIPADPVALWFDEFDILVRRVKNEFSNDVGKALEAALASYRVRPRTTHQVTAHNDLGVEHILVNDGSVCGIIDWADAATANGFVDFAGIWGWGGDAAVAACFDSYYVEPDSNDLAQIRIQGICYALEQIYYGQQIANVELQASATQWVIRRVLDGELNNVYAAL